MRAVCVLMVVLLLFGACVPALAQGQEQGQAREPTAADKVQGLVGRVQALLSKIGEAVLPLALLAAGLLLVVNPKAGVRLIGVALLAGFLLLGGWQLLVGLVREVLP